MTVYVDDMRAKFRMMLMCHMIADTEDELHAMADRIGIQRKWFQRDHYDISRGKRDLAVRYGAVEITWRQAGFMMTNRRAGYPFGTPETAEKIALKRRADRSAPPEQTLGGVRLKPMQRDLFTGELVKTPKRAYGDQHIRLKGADSVQVIPGMAHFSHSGPERTYCFQCVYLCDLEIHRGGRYTPRGGVPAMPLRVELQACKKAADLYGGIVQRGGLAGCSSCKYFEPRPNGGSYYDLPDTA